MSIWRRSDGSVAVDWAGGPFIVLSAAHWALLRAWVEDNGRLEEK